MAFGKVHAYAVCVVGSAGVIPGTAVEQVTIWPMAFVTVQATAPAGLYPEEPETMAVKVVVPPRVGETDEEIETDGVRFEIPSVTEFESAARKLTLPP